MNLAVHNDGNFSIQVHHHPQLDYDMEIPFALDNFSLKAARFSIFYPIEPGSWNPVVCNI